MTPPARVVETHTATIFFVGERAYKLKKALDLGFLDHTTREARLASCQAEVELNRRLAPDVYLGVLDIVDEAGRPQDHLVAMRRMPDDRRLAACLERGDDVDDALRQIVHDVATLHSRPPADDRHDHLASPAEVRQRWSDGFDQLRPLADRLDRHERLTRSEALVARYLDGREPLLHRRIADGWIRDGHGDLQAEDIFVLDDGPRILDCIEFGEDYRWGDVLSDIAFLAMDLERLGRRDLATELLARHKDLTADRWPASLAHHYVAYRAHVRAKVGLLRHAQHDEQVGAEVDALVDLSLRHLEQAQVQLVMVGGLPGTGKSTLAAGLGDHLGAVVLRTDEIRRRMADPADTPTAHTSTSDTPTPDGRYRPEQVDAVYRRMADEARQLLGLGEHVVVDATWASAENRDRFRALAGDTSSTLTELRCTLPAAVAAARIEQRRADGEDPSEATSAVAAAMAERFAPWPEAVEVSTDGDVADSVARGIDAVDQGDP